MKRASTVVFLFLLACLLFFWTGHVVFQAPADLKHDCDKERFSLIKDLEQIPYQPEQYKENVFDCSNMSALLFDKLSKKGYKCELVVGWILCIFSSNDCSCHAWIIAEKDGCKFWVEPTTKKIVSPNFYRKYVIRHRFNSIEKAKEISKKKWFWSEKEWEY